ncbi:hypothetical protein CDV55_107279 [Aspergillus turcosus]|uniref:Uncharacterized protein n=1 Tax=Aspergillus turcosus TaxID=1245748 RepID=A0A397ID83_9EURO|nr:hypothetical protein CDV55_107279 [Aspergillus turcosus]RLM01913.1 hypothetical protein CFD26_107947 [Aspergillus turcosus]
MQTAVPSNSASSQKGRLSTTSQPTDNREMILVPFSVQPQSSQSQTTSGRGYLTPEQQLEVIKWCLSHKEWYADQNLCFKGEFWFRCGGFIKEKFNKKYAAPERMVRGLENRRRQEIAAGGIWLARDDLKQALDMWIQFLDDTKRRAEERKARIAAQQSSQPSLGEQARELLCRGMAEQREARIVAQQSSQPTQPTPGDQAREQLCRRMAKRRRDPEQDQSDGDTSENESSESPRASERRRKKLRRMREQERETELYTTALTNALTSFGTGFSNSLSSSLSKALSEPIQGVENQLKELKTQRNELHRQMNELRLQMHEFNAQMNEKTSRILQLLQEMREERLNRKISKVEG